MTNNNVAAIRPFIYIVRSTVFSVKARVHSCLHFSCLPWDNRNKNNIRYSYFIITNHIPPRTRFLVPLHLIYPMTNYYSIINTNYEKRAKEIVIEIFFNSPERDFLVYPFDHCWNCILSLIKSPLKIKGPSHQRYVTTQYKFEILKYIISWGLLNLTKTEFLTAYLSLKICAYFYRPAHLIMV